jgi:hypothetical protein
LNCATNPVAIVHGDGSCRVSFFLHPRSSGQKTPFSLAYPFHQLLFPIPAPLLGVPGLVVLAIQTRRLKLSESGLAREAAWLQKGSHPGQFPGVRPVDIISQDWRNYPLVGATSEASKQSTRTWAPFCSSGAGYQYQYQYPYQYQSYSTDSASWAPSNAPSKVSNGTRRRATWTMAMAWHGMAQHGTAWVRHGSPILYEYVLYSYFRT